jgi:hypothetical protein
VLPEQFGLGGWLEFVGRSIIRGRLVVPDDLTETDSAAIEELASARLGPTAVDRVSEFCDPRSGVFAARCYSGAGWCVGADLGRSFGLIAEHCGARKGKHAGSWEVWLPGWGVCGPKGWHRMSPHRPALYIEARRVGWQLEFGPCGTIGGKPAGKRVKGRAWRGMFIDVLSLGYTLDADRSATFAEHHANARLAPIELPIAVAVDADGAAQIIDTLFAIHGLVEVLDDVRR